MRKFFPDRTQYLLLILTIISATCCFVNPAYSSGNFDYSFSDSFNLALDNNESLKAAEKEVAASYSEYRAAFAEWFPKFNIYFDTHYYKKTPFDSTGTGEAIEIVPGVKMPSSFLSASGMDYYETNFGLGISQLLLDSGLITSQIKQKKIKYEISKMKLYQTKQDLALKLVKKYFKLLELDKNIELLKKQVKRYGNLLDTAIRKNRLEEIGELGVLRREINFQEAQFNLATKIEERDSAEEEFLFLLGMKSGYKIKLKENVDFSFTNFDDLDFVVEKIEHENPDVIKARYALELKKIAVDQAKTDQRPNMMLYGDLGAYKTGDTLAKSMEEFDEIWKIGVRLDWPFFDTGRTRNKVVAASASRQNAEIELKKMGHLPIEWVILT